MNWLGLLQWVAVNPARAGMILAIIRCKKCGNGKPRASGDDPQPTKTCTDGDA